ncbi:hypothetical protein BMS3Abin03_01288 [bacterium BMS3Abin03]|nr:hypothetical protein BMS3Abin03_01288 [bacterium BMS3Abin03]
MKRILYDELLKWKKIPNRKPLLLQGARQVGKTYLITVFGQKEYSDTVYLNFEQEPEIGTLFAGSLNPENLIENISLYIGRKITPNNLLIIFDEIQVSEEAISSLKYFYEQAPEYHIIAAGSLLGVSVGKQKSFPVGKVNFMTMNPMNFAEYLMAFDEELLLEKLTKIKTVEPLSEVLHNKLLSHFKMYLFLGGMPEVVQNYLDNRDVVVARTLQNEILESYSRDFSKYTVKSQTIKTSEVWNSIPYQLAKENKKFKYSDVRKRARASMFEQTIEWLKKAGLIYLAYNVNTSKIPLSGYADRTKFKVYLIDTGILGAMLNISSDIILKGSELFSEYNGAFIENYVASELTSLGNKELFYWTSRSDAEVDFLIQLQNKIFPVEIKSGTSRNLKSLRSYANRYNPEFIIRVSPRNFIKDKDFINIPLYAVFNLHNLISIL